MTLPEARCGFPTYRSASGAEPARVAAQMVTSRGFGISYDDVGEGPTIVLVSGFSQSGGDWWELGYVDSLVASGRRVLVVDPLGHGGSDRPHDPDAYKCRTSRWTSWRRWTQRALRKPFLAAFAAPRALRLAET